MCFSIPQPAVTDRIWSIQRWPAKPFLKPDKFSWTWVILGANWSWLVALNQFVTPLYTFARLLNLNPPLTSPSRTFSGFRIGVLFSSLTPRKRQTGFVLLLSVHPLRTPSAMTWQSSSIYSCSFSALSLSLFVLMFWLILGNLKNSISFHRCLFPLLAGLSPRRRGMQLKW